MIEKVKEINRKKWKESKNRKIPKNWRKVAKNCKKRGKSPEIVRNGEKSPKVNCNWSNNPSKSGSLTSIFLFLVPFFSFAATCYQLFQSFWQHTLDTLIHSFDTITRTRPWRLIERGLFWNFWRNIPWKKFENVNKPLSGLYFWYLWYYWYISIGGHSIACGQ